MNAQEYMYHGSGFGYSCTDGWLNASPDINQSYSAPLEEAEGVSRLLR